MNDDVELAIKITLIGGVLVGFILGVTFMLHIYDSCFPKYCPECGSNYSSSYEYCSVDGTLLKDRGDV